MVRSIGLPAGPTVLNRPDLATGDLTNGALLTDQHSDRRRDKILGLYPTATWTNATFSSYLCCNLSEITESVTLRLSNTQIRFLLPDCFYGMAQRVVQVDLTNIIIQGNSSIPDPLQRLASAIGPSPETFALTSCHLRTPSGSNATINWNTISKITSSVFFLSFSGTHLGIGSTIPTFPRPFSTLRLDNAGLSGPLPLTLYSSSTPVRYEFYFAASSNALTGPIPSTLFQNIDFALLNVFSLSLANNKLNGTVPSSLLAGSFSTCGDIYIDLERNNFVGPLQNVLASTTFSSSDLATFEFKGSHNDFTGMTPAWLSSMEAQSMRFTFACDFCKLQALTSFLPSGVPGGHYIVSLQYNQFSNEIPDDFFHIGATAGDMAIDLTGNSFTVIPALPEIDFTGANVINIKLTSNRLNGPFPTSPGLLSNALSAYRLSLVGNTALTGSIPDSFWASFVDLPSRVHTIEIALANTGLTGTLNLPAFSDALNRLRLDVSSSNLLMFTYPINATSGLTTLRLNDNPQLSGQLSASFFENNPNLQALYASSTQLNGTMPDMGSINPPSLTELHLASTAIDFCSENRTVWTGSSLSSCNLGATSAYYCSTTYPNCGTSAPPTLPVCSESTRPSPSFTCINGTWTFIGSIDSTVITIPSGASTTTIKGNLTSATVIISGLNSVLVVDGCTSNVTIIIELTPDQLKTIGSEGKLQQLLSYSNTSSCNSSLSDTTIATKINGSSCQKVSVSKESSSDGTVSGLFKIDKIDCDRWWIILVSVIAAIVVLVVVLVLLALFVPPIRECVRPYSKPRRKPQVN